MLDTMTQHLQGINKEKVLKSFDFRTFLKSLARPCGGDKRDRTADLLNAIQALSQLSYTPIFGADIISLIIIATEQEFVKRYAEKLAI